MQCQNLYYYTLVCNRGNVWDKHLRHIIVYHKLGKNEPESWTDRET